MTKNSETIGFRLTTAQLAIVDQLRIPLGLSRGDWAKGVVLAHLVQSSQVDAQASRWDELMAAMEELRQVNHKVHENVSRSLYVLMNVPHPLDTHDARAIVRENLIP